MISYVHTSCQLCNLNISFPWTLNRKQSSKNDTNLMRTIFIFPIKTGIKWQFFDSNQRNKFLCMSLLKIIWIENIRFDKLLDWLYLSSLWKFSHFFQILLSQNNINTCVLILHIFLIPVCKIHIFWLAKRHVIIPKILLYSVNPGQRFSNWTSTDSQFANCIK